MDSRVVKPRSSPRVIVTSVLIGLFVMGFVLTAVWYSNRGIIDAKKTGVIVEKQFVPQVEQQITLGREGAIKSHEKEGEYILTVDVPQRDGTKKTFQVFVNKKLYESLQVGEKFDVGPYVVP